MGLLRGLCASGCALVLPLQHPAAPSRNQVRALENKRFYQSQIFQTVAPGTRPDGPCSAKFSTVTRFLWVSTVSVLRMRLVALGVCVAFLGAVSGTAEAQTPNWLRAYIGAQGGYAWEDLDLTAVPSFRK